MTQLNKCVYQGNLVADPEFYGDNDTVARFTLANNTGFGEHRATNFLPCVVFGKLVEIVKNYLRKGSEIIVEAETRQSSWVNDDGQKRSRFEWHIRQLHFTRGTRPREEEDEAVPARKLF